MPTKKKTAEKVEPKAASRDCVISVNVSVEGYENSAEIIIPNLRGRVTGSQIASGAVEKAIYEGLVKAVGNFKWTS